jgi:hypothetical protein
MNTPPESGYLRKTAHDVMHRRVLPGRPTSSPNLSPIDGIWNIIKKDLTTIEYEDWSGLRSVIWGISGLDPAHSLSTVPLGDRIEQKTSPAVITSS